MRPLASYLPVGDRTVENRSQRTTSPMKNLGIAIRCASADPVPPHVVLRREGHCGMGCEYRVWDQWLSRFVRDRFGCPPHHPRRREPDHGGVHGTHTGPAVLLRGEGLYRDASQPRVGRGQRRGTGTGRGDVHRGVFDDSDRCAGNVDGSCFRRRRTRVPVLAAASAVRYLDDRPELQQREHLHLDARRRRGGHVRHPGLGASAGID